MRTTVAGAAALVVVAALGVAGSVAHADPADDTPSQADVDAARNAARAKARDVAAVQADLVLANQRLETAAIEAGKAAEAYNGARWKLQQARKKVRAAEPAAGAPTRRGSCCSSSPACMGPTTSTTAASSATRRAEWGCKPPSAAARPR